MGNIVTDKKRLWPNGVIPYVFGEGFAVWITSWVGRRSNAQGKGNLEEDVRLVQGLLNRVPASEGGPTKPLVVDGLTGTKTEGAIQKFQLHRFGWKGADSRVDPDGPTLTALAEYQDDPDKDDLMAALDEWNTIFLGRMLWRPAEEQDFNYVEIIKTTGKGRNSSETLGRKPEGGAQFLRLNPGKVETELKKFGRVTKKGVILHEMGHVAGLGHEHQRCDRKKHVRIQNVGRCCDYRIAMADPDCPESTGCSPFTPCTPDGDYDFSSTMHYFSHQGAKKEGIAVIVAIDRVTKEPREPQPKMGRLDGLGRGDVATLERFYPPRVL